MNKLLLSVALLAAPAALSAQEPVQRDTAWHNHQALYLIQLPAADGWQSTASGLRYRKVRGGEAGAASPAATDTVTIHYVGRLLDGTEFDSSVARGEPATFPLPRLIRGWQEGVPLMSVGDTYEFAIPYHLAYGPVGRAPIPGGATLLFTVELLGIGERPAS